VAHDPQLTDRRPIETAPDEGDFLAYNEMTGWYRTRRESGEFPMRGWDDKQGIWYPRPSYWKPLWKPPLGGAHGARTGDVD
jgi:hypothetical protein